MRLPIFLLMLITGMQAQAALNITPPQLAPDQDGIVATEVRSSLSTPTRWSVRVTPWDPLAPSTERGAALPIASKDSGPPSAAYPPLGVDVSPRFFSLAGSGRQMIRAKVFDRSQYYRLVIEQIPLESPTDPGVNFRFRFSLPIYRSPTDPLIPPGLSIP